MTIDIRTLLFINMHMLYIRKQLLHCTPQIRHKWKQVRMELVTLFAAFTEESEAEIIQDLLCNENIIQNLYTHERSYSDDCYKIHETVRNNLEEDQESSTEDKLIIIEDTINWLKIKCND